MPKNKHRSIRPDFRPDMAEAGLAVEVLARRARYRGNPQHKRFPADYGLTPPAAPRIGKTLCDERKHIGKVEAESLLQSAIKKGVFSSRLDNGYPRRIWAVDAEGFVFEARLDDSERGIYHGYPLASSQRGIIEFIQKAWAEK